VNRRAFFGGCGLRFKDLFRLTEQIFGSLVPIAIGIGSFVSRQKNKMSIIRLSFD
jgi:hypothetical protein